MIQQIEFPRTLAVEILHHAQLNPEVEVCGLIGGRNAQAQHCYAVDNIAENPSCVFSMDPRQQIQAMRRMRESGESLFGIYHSHPHSPAIPSQKDIEESGYPEAIYFVVSLNTKGVLEMNGFKIQDKQVTPVELIIVEE